VGVPHDVFTDYGQALDISETRGNSIRRPHFVSTGSA